MPTTHNHPSTGDLDPFFTFDYVPIDAPEEVQRCEPFLARQVALVKPKLIIAMGRFAVETLLQSKEPIGRLRGRVHQYQGVPVIVTYHPAYLLRTPADKAKAWADLCLALEQGGVPAA